MLLIGYGVSVLQPEKSSAYHQVWGKRDCSIAVMKHFIIGLCFLIPKTDFEELECLFLTLKIQNCFGSQCSYKGFPPSVVVNNPPANAGDMS